MSEQNQNAWEKMVRQILDHYDERLLRNVAQKLVRPRNSWPVQELLDRSLETLANPVLIDRRLKELDPVSGLLIALLSRSNQPFWALAQVVELAMALGLPDGIKPVLNLLEHGFLFTHLSATGEGVSPQGKKPLIKSFEHWLGTATDSVLTLFVPETVLARARALDLAPSFILPPEMVSKGPFTGRNVDGLEIPLRLAVLVQLVRANPARLNQQGTFFKRDSDRFREDPLLLQVPADSQEEVPDLGIFFAELARKSGLLSCQDSNLVFSSFPEPWSNGLGQLLSHLWDSLNSLELWNSCEGYREEAFIEANPFPAACFFAMAALGCQPDSLWIDLEALEPWVMARHPYWIDPESVRPSRQSWWLRPYILGVAFQLGMVEVSHGERKDWVRLSAMGRRIMRLEKPAAPIHDFSRTLLVQPNLEILAYRQGLTPSLIANLTRLAVWKAIGPACQLVLEPESIYSALESGMRHDEIRALLERHTTRPLPQAVLDSLQTWANKHERIAIFASATLLEFPSQKELEEALSRGLSALRISDRFAIATSENEIDYSHFKLTATRDYGLHPTVCVTARADGVTLVEDVASSDLILETELPRFADFDSGQSTQQQRVYILSPDSLKRGLQTGLTREMLEEWFKQRLNQPMTSACNLLLGLEPTPESPFIEELLVVQMANEDLANGLAQWPETAGWIHKRLGPTAFSVQKENLPRLREAMSKVGLTMRESL